ncbi:hypothetical protein WI41_11840 [Burkholderia latens]|uniref:Uncharacterized protein n=1 Tax=Burkholderia latens TaxID=488446 RepID=A0AAP1C4L9_9BURK|nr:hypothetical protein WI41_11840 [Burkholderia latens]
MLRILHVSKPRAARPCKSAGIRRRGPWPTVPVTFAIAGSANGLRAHRGARPERYTSESFFVAVSHAPAHAGDERPVVERDAAPYDTASHRPARRFPRAASHSLRRAVSAL